jgi:hypothetical protein
MRGDSKWDEGLTQEQRDWVICSEARWRQAAVIAIENPGLDTGDLYHALGALELTPSERLRRGLTRVRVRSHAG